jgi:hypothetical protein
MKALRICWAALATPLMTSAMTGRVSEVTQAADPAPGEMLEIAGNNPSSMASTQTRTTPMMKPGSALPTIAPTWTRRSTHPRRTAATIPSRVATTAMATIAVRTIASVIGSRLTMAPNTGSLVNQDRPSSPRTAPPSQSASRVRSGWSSPSSVARAATASSVAWSPRMLRAMLPEEE